MRASGSEKMFLKSHLVHETSLSTKFRAEKLLVVDV